MAEQNPLELSPEEKDYNLYIEERKILVASLEESSKSFDKAVLTLASGSFGFTVAFLKDIVPHAFENTKWLLHYSWGLFAISILIILISFLTSQKASEKQIDIDYEVIVEKKKLKQNAWSKLTKVLNYSSIIILITAYIFWSLFVFYNY